MREGRPMPAKSEIRIDGLQTAGEQRAAEAALEQMRITDAPVAPTRGRWSAEREPLSDAIIKRLPNPERGNKPYWDSAVSGFGIIVTAAGAKSFIFNYRTKAGRQRRFTIGAFPNWT